MWLICLYPDLHLPLKDHMFLHYGTQWEESMPWSQTVGVEVQLHSFSTLEPDKGKRSISRPGEKNSGTHWIWAWVGPGDGVGILENRKCLAPGGIWTPDPPAHSLVTILTMLPQLHNNIISSNFIPGFWNGFFHGLQFRQWVGAYISTPLGWTAYVWHNFL